MKKTVLLFALAISIISCNKTTETKEFKTAYIDTSLLMEESTEAKDIGEKYKDKSKVMGSQLEVEVNRFKSEAANFQKNAQSNGYQKKHSPCIIGCTANRNGTRNRRKPDLRRVRYFGNRLFYLHY
jgi:Skp family chaperone for outer membrane proteins